MLSILNRNVIIYNINVSKGTLNDKTKGEKDYDSEKSKTRW